MEHLLDMDFQRVIFSIDVVCLSTRFSIHLLVYRARRRRTACKVYSYCEERKCLNVQIDGRILNHTNMLTFGIGI